MQTLLRYLVLGWLHVHYPHLVTQVNKKLTNREIKEIEQRIGQTIH